MSSVTVSYFSVHEEDPDLYNEVNLFSAMPFSVFSLIGFSKSESDAFCFFYFQITNHVFDFVFFWMDQWNIVRHDPLFRFVPNFYKTDVI